MAIATITTDLIVIDDCDALTNWLARSGKAPTNAVGGDFYVQGAGAVGVADKNAIGILSGLVFSHLTDQGSTIDLRNKHLFMYMNMIAAGRTFSDGMLRIR